MAGLLLLDPINTRYAVDATNMQLWSAHYETRCVFVAQDGPVVLFDYDNHPHLAEGLPLRLREGGGASADRRMFDPVPASIQPSRADAQGHRSEDVGSPVRHARADRRTVAVDGERGRRNRIGRRPDRGARRNGSRKTLLLGDNRLQCAWRAAQNGIALRPVTSAGGRRGRKDRNCRS